jgi:uncharacterized membrane protein
MNDKKNFYRGRKDTLEPENAHEKKKRIGKAASAAADQQAQKNVESIMALEKEAIQSRSAAEKMADKITKAAGSTAFIIFHLFWFGGWILLNVSFVPGIRPFDPFPYSFLTLVVSLEAIFLTLLVLMSQNRMTKEADKRAHLDLQVNMLAEQEATTILRMVQKIGKHLGLEKEMDDTKRELAEETDVHQLAKALDQKTPD